MKFIPPLRLAVAWLATLVAILAAEPAPEPAVIRAVRVRSTAEWQALPQKKADVNARDAAGNTALHLAALHHDLPAVAALLAAGAEVDAKNAAGATPLLYGAGHTEIAQKLSDRQLVFALSGRALLVNSRVRKKTRSFELPGP